MTEKRWLYSNGPFSTHYLGCWKNHIHCALYMARSLMAALDRSLLDHETIRELEEFLKGTAPEYELPTHPQPE